MTNHDLIDNEIFQMLLIDRKSHDKFTIAFNAFITYIENLSEDFMYEEIERKNEQQSDFTRKERILYDECSDNFLKIINQNYDMEISNKAKDCMLDEIILGYCKIINNCEKCYEQKKMIIINSFIIYKTIEVKKSFGYYKLNFNPVITQNKEYIMFDYEKLK